MTKQTRFTGVLSAFLLTLGLLVTANAAPLSFNVLPAAFDGGVDEMASTDEAGVTPLANWNNVVFPSGNFTGFTTSAGDFVDADGTTVSTTLAFSSNGNSSQQSFLGRVTSNPTPNEKMMGSGAIAFSGSQVQTWTFSDLPASLSGNFEVIVYWGGVASGSSSGDEVISAYTIGTETLSLTYKRGATGGSEVEHWRQAPANGGFVESSSATATYGPNYVRFSGLSGSSFSLQVAQGAGSDSRPGLSGIQVIPEPGTLALAGVALAALLLFRRR